ncbi:hypothetical protein ACFV2B_39845, partial [Streptomyces lavendulae]
PPRPPPPPAARARAPPRGSRPAGAAAFGVDHLLIEGCDVGAVRARLAAPVERVRSGRPLVVEFRSAADWYAVYDVAGDAAFSAAEHRQRARMDRVVDEVLALEPSAWEHCG